MSELQAPDRARFQITHQPLDSAPLVALVSSPGHGAIVTFAGVARDNFAGRPTAYDEDAKGGHRDTQYNDTVRRSGPSL